MDREIQLQQEDTSHINRRLQDVIRYHNELHEFLEDILKKDNRDDVLDAYLRYVFKIFRVHGYILYLIDRATLEFIPQRMNSLSEECRDHAERNKDLGLFAWVISMKRPTFVPLPALGDSAVRTAIITPLVAVRRPIGVLYVVSPLHEEEVTQQDFYSIYLLSKQVAIGLENLELIEEEKQLVEERTRAQEQARYSAELEEKNRLLHIKNENYMEMLGFVSHELKNPLATVMEYTNLFAEGLLGDLDREQGEAIAAMYRNLTYIHSMIANYLDLSRIERGEMQLRKERVNLREEILEPVVLDLRERMNACGASAESLLGKVPAEVFLAVDRQLMRIVFGNLLSNAFKYGNAGESVAIGITEKKGLLYVSVSNEGAGISEDDRERIFEKFVRLPHHDGFRQKGTGLGLYITRNIIELHGGRIWVESSGRNVVFTFTIPGDCNGKPLLVPFTEE